MMQLNEVLSLECSKISVPCTSKKRALELLSEIAAEYGKLDSEPLFERLLEREKVGSTAIGNSVAMPHGKIALVEYEDTQNESEQEESIFAKKSPQTSAKTIAVLITSEEPIDFGAADKRPVEVLFALFVPENQCDIHLKTLTTVSKALSEPATVKKLRYAESDQELYDILINAYDDVIQEELQQEIDAESEESSDS